jgi:YD repeat-containing protein
VTRYDAAGRRDMQCRKLTLGDGWDDPRDGTDVEGVTCRHFELDALGRVVAETDEEGRTTRFGHDESGRLVSVTDAAGGLTRYEYDGLGRMRAQVDAMERVTQYEHDEAGRRKARILPLQQREDFAYTLTGALKRHVDFARTATVHAIDPLTDRIASTDLPGVAGPRTRSSSTTPTARGGR